MRYLFPYEKRVLRIILLILMVVLFIGGILTKEYIGPHRHWFKNYCGDMVFVMFFYFFIKFINPHFNTIGAVALNYSGVAAIEFTQIIKNPTFDNIRSTFLGQLILGQHFDPNDFIYYGLGLFLAVAIFSILFRVVKNRENIESEKEEQLVMDF